MSALAQDPVSTVPSTSSPDEAFRAQLEALRTDCLREREEALKATAGYGVDAVVWARSAALERILEESNGHSSSSGAGVGADSG